MCGDNYNIVREAGEDIRWIGEDVEKVIVKCQLSPHQTTFIIILFPTQLISTGNEK